VNSKITAQEWPSREPQHGFSLIEMMLALAILLSVMGIVTSGLLQTSKAEGTISNRTQMHASVRDATELLQQEIGQSGRIVLPQTILTNTAVVNTDLGSLTGTTINVMCATTPCTTGLFDTEQLVIDVGQNQETVTLISHTSTSITATFSVVHASGVPVTVQGGFASGIVPPSYTCAGSNCGSTDWVLKLYGDINSDGNMVYIEYTCGSSTGPASTGDSLYRNTMSFTAASKPALTSSMVLLPNILPNPSNSACFTYQVKTIGSADYVVNVAVTLTVQTQLQDPQTHQYQTETKALLNVSPRNVFETWELASSGYINRIQPMPASITALLP